jgi:hypothetical protein
MDHAQRGCVAPAGRQSLPVGRPISARRPTGVVAISAEVNEEITRVRRGLPPADGPPRLA